MDVLIGTSNPGKRAEFEQIFSGLPLRLLTLRDAGLADMDVPEDGATLAENATIKATAYGRASGLVTLADDTGLFVDALGGDPGIYPARYGGPGLTMAQRRQKLLAALAGVPGEQRGARFRCVIAIHEPDGTLHQIEGVVEGRIAQAEQDTGEGFGYDCLFIPVGHEVTFAMLPAAQKNLLSHRGRAAALAAPILARLAAQL